MASHPNELNSVPRQECELVSEESFQEDEVASQPSTKFSVLEDGPDDKIEISSAHGNENESGQEDRMEEESSDAESSDSHTVEADASTDSTAITEETLKECVSSKANIYDRVDKYIEVLKSAKFDDLLSSKDDHPSPDPSAIMFALSELELFCESTGNVRYFYSKVGGHRLLLEWLGSCSVPSKIRAMCATILGSCAQNNPSCQVAFAEDNALSILLKSLSSELSSDPSSHVLVKIVFALSSLIRGSVELTKLFFKANDGVQTLANIVSNLKQNERAAKKALFLLVCLSQEECVKLPILPSSESFLAAVKDIKENHPDATDFASSYLSLLLAQEDSTQKEQTPTVQSVPSVSVENQRKTSKTVAKKALDIRKKNLKSKAKERKSAISKTEPETSLSNQKENSSASQNETAQKPLVSFFGEPFFHQPKKQDSQRPMTNLHENKHLDSCHDDDRELAATNNENSLESKPPIDEQSKCSCHHQQSPMKKVDHNHIPFFATRDPHMRQQQPCCSHHKQPPREFVRDEDFPYFVNQRPSHRHESEGCCHDNSPMNHNDGDNFPFFAQRQPHMRQPHNYSDHNEPIPRVFVRDGPTCVRQRHPANCCCHEGRSRATMDVDGPFTYDRDIPSCRYEQPRSYQRPHFATFRNPTISFGLNDFFPGYQHPPQQPQRSNLRSRTEASPFFFGRPSRPSFGDVFFGF